MALGNRISVFFHLVLSIFLCTMMIGARPARFDSTALLISPTSIIQGEKFRVLLVLGQSQKNITLDIFGLEGRLHAGNKRQGGGGPFWWYAEFTAGPAGDYKILYQVGETSPEEYLFPVEQAKKLRAKTAYIWQTERDWTQETEYLYSAWIQMLFQAKQEGGLWDYLHDITRDPSRNFLIDHLGLDEDQSYYLGGLRMVPDCADNPFFLRAYFAWKLGLPYGYFKCDRGKQDRAPLCRQWLSNHSQRKPGTSDVKAFQYFLISIMDSIHSGSARTALTAEASDLYPVPLTRDSLRPGTVFADPYGHTLTLVNWFPQQGNNPGRLLAVDAQPDGTIGLKRFWQGSFFFNTSGVIGGPGFKRFRPIIEENGRLRIMNNREINTLKDYKDFSTQQEGMNPQLFYDLMDRLINPNPLKPEKIYQNLHEAIQELLNARVQAVNRGEEYMRSTGYKVVPMPSGAGIFQTTGSWEDFSTPSRDLRLLISLDVLLDFPHRILRNPKAFAIPENKTPLQVQQELLDLHAEWSREFSISYIRSDGTAHKLTLAEVILRQKALEMAYNPNDCVEIRWGAPEGSAEFSSCRRHTPIEQREKMEQYRHWFRTRTFPRR